MQRGSFTGGAAVALGVVVVAAAVLAVHEYRKVPPPEPRSPGNATVAAAKQLIGRLDGKGESSSGPPAEGIDSRLATVKKAYVVAMDELAEDHPATVCFRERLAASLPITSVDSQASADVVLRISAHSIPLGKRLIGRRSEAHIEAQLPDGTVLWSGRARPFSLGSPDGCKFANELLDELGDAMRKARGK